MEDIIAIVGFFSTVIIVTLGFPLVRVYAKRKEQEPQVLTSAMTDRLARMESAIDAMAIEIERISEGQRFVTKLLAEREQAKAALPRDASS